MCLLVCTPSVLYSTHWLLRKDQRQWKEEERSGEIELRSLWTDSRAQLRVRRFLAPARCAVHISGAGAIVSRKRRASSECHFHMKLLNIVFYLIEEDCVADCLKVAYVMDCLLFSHCVIAKPRLYICILYCTVHHSTDLFSESGKQFGVRVQSTNLA